MKTTMKFDINEMLPIIIKDVERGFSIKSALERHKLNRQWFYRKMSSQQKAELQIAKTSSVTYSSRHTKGMPSSKAWGKLNKDIMINKIDFIGQDEDEGIDRY